MDRPQNADHGQRMLCHFLALVEAVTDPQSGAACGFGAEHRLVARSIRGIVAKEPSRGERECLAPPRIRREVRAVCRDMTEPLIGVPDRDRHRQFDPRILLQIPIGSVLMLGVARSMRKTTPSTSCAGFPSPR